jgi:hypothetical protein
MAAKLKEEYIAKPEWNKTFHYVPIKMTVDLSKIS